MKFIIPLIGLSLFTHTLFSQKKFFVEYQNNKFGFVNEIGEVLIPFKYESANPFTEGLAVVRENNRFQCIDTNGKVVLDLSAYNLVAPFIDGLSAVWLGNKCGFIDKTGKVVIPFTFDH